MQTRDIANEPLAAIDELPRPLVTRAHDHPPGHRVDWHRHRRDQLLYASAGTMLVQTAVGIWVVPPHRAVWIPGGVRHRVRGGETPLLMRTVYVEPGIAPGLPDGCCVVSVSPLLRELILRAVSLPDLYDQRGADGRLMRVLLDQIRDLPVTPLHLPGIRDRRLAPIARCLDDDPADARGAAEWAARLGMSARTLSRRFRRDTGMSFRQWRQQLRLLQALRRLAEGQRVNAVALELGYESPSAFVAMFRRSLGATPGRYFDD